MSKIELIDIIQERMSSVPVSSAYFRAGLIVSRRLLKEMRVEDEIKRDTWNSKLKPT